MRPKAETIMDRAEYEALLSRIGINKFQLAKLLKRDEKAPQRWAEKKVPNEAAILLRLLALRPELRPVIEELAEKAGTE